MMGGRERVCAVNILRTIAFTVNTTKKLGERADIDEQLREEAGTG